MRTTLNIPENLLAEAMQVTQSRTKTEVIKFALENVIRKSRLQKLKSYRGQVEFEIDLDLLRKRQ